MPKIAQSKGQKNRGLQFSKAEMLAMSFRRLQIRRQKAQSAKRADDEARAQARHERAMVRRESTRALAQARIKACRQHPSAFAVRQLVGIARNPKQAVEDRIVAAATVLRWSGPAEPGTDGRPFGLGPKERPYHVQSMTTL